MSKVKIVAEGQPCRNCNTPVVNVDTGFTGPKLGSKYYFKGYFYCYGCGAMYMDDSRKVIVQPGEEVKYRSKKGKVIP